MKITNEDEASFTLPFKIFLHKKGYLVENEDGNYIEMNEQMLRRRLRLRGIVEEKASILLDFVSQNNYVDLYAELAGYAPGLHTINNVRVLVTRGVPMIPAVKGDWSTASQLFDNMFGEEQLKYFFTWWQTARWRLVNHEWIPLQSIVLAGPPGAGKTTLLHLLGKSFGKKASPFDYIKGKTAFNEDLASAPLLAMDDEHSSAMDQKDQNLLTDFLKWVAVKPDHRVAPKGQKAHQLDIITIAAICTNLEPQNLKIIPPPFELDMRNRLHLFMCSKAAMPMPVTTVKEKQAFYAKLESMIPAIHYFLDKEWETPSEIVDSDKRFPCKAWQHPEILSLIMKESRVMKFRDTVLSVIIHDQKEKKQFPVVEWYTASDLSMKLKRSELRGASRFAKDVQVIGNLLAKWKKLCPTEIRDRKLYHGINKWRIVPPPEFEKVD
jgi:hypothetical protein